MRTIVIHDADGTISGLAVVGPSVRGPIGLRIKTGQHYVDANIAELRGTPTSDFNRQTLDRIKDTYRVHPQTSTLVVRERRIR